MAKKRKKTTKTPITDPQIMAQKATDIQKAFDCFENKKGIGRVYAGYGTTGGMIVVVNEKASDEVKQKIQDKAKKMSCKLHWETND